MPLTSSLLGGGVTVNEIHGNPAGPGQDYNGNGIADGSDSYVELLNTSGGPIDISGWEIHVFGSVSHTFAPGTILAAGDHITVVNSNAGTAFPITGVSGMSVYSDSPQAFGDPVNLVLYDPGANQYIMIGGASAATWVAFDTNALTGLHPGATQVGSYEQVPSQVAGTAHARAGDGDSTWQADTPTPGSVNCFLAGTMITTPSGEVAVESLAPGDRVATADGGVALVKFLFCQTLLTRFHPAERLLPVCIGAGALANDQPHSDLTVTADHAMLIDGVLCHAAALVNGTSITRVPLSQMGESFTVYHVETEAHEIILANGAPAETFIDNVGRQAFDNFAEFEALHGAVPEMQELPYPRAMSARQIPARIRAWLNGADLATG